VQAQRAASEGTEGRDQPAPRRLGAAATTVLQKFYEEAKAKGSQEPMGHRMQVRLRTPNTP
jgi:hypothetical protein